MHSTEDMDQEERYRRKLASSLLTAVKNHLLAALGDPEYDLNEDQELRGYLEPILAQICDLAPDSVASPEYATQAEADAEYAKGFRRGFNLTWKTPFTTPEGLEEHTADAVENIYWRLDYLPYGLSLKMANAYGYREGYRQGQFFTYAWTHLPKDEQTKALARLQESGE